MKFFFVTLCTAKIEGATVRGLPLSLCLFCLFLFGCNFDFHGFYQLCQLFLAFLSCLGVDILGYAFAVNSWREPPLVEVVVYHRHATRATLSYLGFIRLKNRFCGVFVAWFVTTLGGGGSGISAFVPPISRSIRTAACCCIVSVIWL